MNTKTCKILVDREIKTIMQTSDLLRDQANFKSFIEHLFTESQKREKDVLDVMQIFRKNCETSFDDAVDAIFRLFKERFGKSESLKLSRFIDSCKADDLNDTACKFGNHCYHFHYSVLVNQFKLKVSFMFYFQLP